MSHEENQSSLEERMADICGRCGLSSCDVKCMDCQIPFHRRCVSESVGVAGSVICDDCATDTANGNEDGEAQNMKSQRKTSQRAPSVFRPSEMGANSTVSVEMYEDLQRKFLDMERKLRRLTHGPHDNPGTLRNSGSVEDDERSADGRDANESSGRQQQSSSEGHDDESWEMQVSRLNESFQLAAPVELTVLQRANRKTLKKDLPKFNGDADQWVTFILAYANSTRDCGFSQSENHDRLEEALTGKAKALVADKLRHPRNVPSILSRLKRQYGQADILLDSVTKKIERMDKLDDNLSNLVWFITKVEEVADVFTVVGTTSKGTDQLKKLVKLLPMTYAERWTTEKASWGADVAGLARYLDKLCDLAIECGRNVTQTRTAKATTPLVKEKLPAKQDKPWTQSKMMMTVVPTKTTTNDECPMNCGSSHPLANCQLFQKGTTADRWSTVRTHKRCMTCLGPHFQYECPNRARCGIQNCRKRHHKLLHVDQSDGQRRDNSQAVTTANSSEIVQASVHRSLVVATKQKEIHFRVLPVVVMNGQKAIKTFALLDTGSGITAMTTSLARRLGLNGTKGQLALQWTNSKTTYYADSERVQFQVSNLDGARRFAIIADTMDDLDLPVASVPAQLLIDEKLNVPVEPYDGCKPELLVGQEYASMTRTIRSVVGATGRVVASETPLGWVVEGVSAAEPQIRRLLLVAAHRVESQLESLVEQFIEADNYGLVEEKDVLRESDECLKARAMMGEMTQLECGRFCTGLLWKRPDVMLPDNRNQAMKRHLLFESKLARQPGLWQRVNELMRSYALKRYIRPAGAIVANRTWYLPIFTVVNPAKPEKLRVVWDAAARYKEVSLNSELMTGPDLTCSLVDILLRFRTGRFAVTGDIEEMFHQVLVKEEDRSAQRFFWRGSADEPMAEFEMCVLLFGATCSPALAQFAKNCNAAAWKEKYPTAANAIIADTYVDDLLLSCDEEEELAADAVNIRTIHASGGMTIHKWQSNSPAVLEALGANSSTGSREVSQFQSCSVLGMIWHTVDDLFSFRLRGEKLGLGLLMGTARPTKREVLSTVMSLFDPLGLLAHRTLEVKLILREAWRLQMPWDVELPRELSARWNKWGLSAKSLEELNIPRWLGTIGGTVELHIFCDASEDALAAVGYVVQPSTGARMMCLAKCKVAPMKSKSIPRLELDAATLGIRVLKMMSKARPWEDVQRVVLWTDARDVLYWIRSTTRRYTTYVANRVSTILKSTAVQDWRWVPTEENPADMATKNRPKGKTEELWLYGPTFIGQPEVEWPDSFAEPDEVQEIRRVAIVREASTSSVLPDATRVTKWIVLIRAAAWVRVIAAVFLKRRKTPTELSYEEEQMGKNEMIKLIQRDLKISEMGRFSPFRDEEGIWRSRGRVAKGDLASSQRYPILLVDHPATRLLVAHFHHHSGHQNHARTLNEIRKEYMVPRLRALTRKVILRCSTCIMRNAKPALPEMAALPLCRLAIGYRAFAYTGVDCFGPMEVLKFRRKEKRWGILFTCLTTRAVYIELLTSMNTESCCGALESFIARRTMPLEFRSDNGTNFVGASKTFRGPRGEQLRWRFNPPGAPHFGGAWERLIGMTKKAMQKTDFSDIKSEEELRRTLMRAERLVNTRPLTEYPVDEDTRECLTPQHILDGSVSTERPFKEDLDLDNFDPKWSLAEKDAVIQHFWDRWTNEYLATLQERKKWTEKAEPLKLGALVYIADADYRNGWRRAVVEEIWRDWESDQVRQVQVRTADGKLFRRAAHHVAEIRVKDM